MKEKHKELLVLITHWYTEWIESYDGKVSKKIANLVKKATKDSNKFIKNEREVLKLLESAYIKLEDITKGKEVEADAIQLCLGCIFLLVEDNYYDRFRTNSEMKMIALDYYSKIEADRGTEQMFRNSNELIAKLGDRYE